MKNVSKNSRNKIRNREIGFIVSIIISRCIVSKLTEPLYWSELLEYMIFGNSMSACPAILTTTQVSPFITRNILLWFDKNQTKVFSANKNWQQCANCSLSHVTAKLDKQVLLLTFHKSVFSGSGLFSFSCRGLSSPRYYLRKWQNVFVGSVNFCVGRCHSRRKNS